jgi:hypothetical protein
MTAIPRIFDRAAFLRVAQPRLPTRRWYILWKARYEDPPKWEPLSEHMRDFIEDERECARAWRSMGYVCAVLSEREVREVQG